MCLLFTELKFACENYEGGYNPDSIFPFRGVGVLSFTFLCNGDMLYIFVVVAFIEV